MDVPTAWTGPSGHLMHGPWVPPFFRDGLAALIAELEAANPPGLAQLLDQRAELLICVMLARGCPHPDAEGHPRLRMPARGDPRSDRGDHSCAAGGSLGDA